MTHSTTRVRNRARALLPPPLRRRPHGPVTSQPARRWIDIEIFSIQAFCAKHSRAFAITWRGAITEEQLLEHVTGWVGTRRSTIHQAIRSFFTPEADGGRERLAQIGYSLPPLAAGDLILIDRLAWVVSDEDEFVLATHNRGLTGAGVLHLAQTHAHQPSDLPAHRI